MLNLTLAELSRITGAEAAAQTDVTVHELCSLEDAREGGICYLTSLEKTDLLKDLKASALIVPEAAKGQTLPFQGVLLYAKNPEWAFILLMKYVDAQKQKYTPGIHPTAVISPSAKLGADVSVGAYTVIEDGVTVGDGTVIFPQCYIGKNVTIGKNCYIYPQVVIREECVLKDYVILQAGAKSARTDSDLPSTKAGTKKFRKLATWCWATTWKYSPTRALTAPKFPARISATIPR